MSHLDVQMKKWTNGIWDNLFPISKTTNIFDKNGKNIQSILDETVKWTKISHVGGKGDGITNDSVALKTLLAKGGNLLIEDGLYLINADVYSVISNTYLKFTENAKIKLLPHNQDGYSMLQCLDSNNVVIDSPKLDGNLAYNSVEGGEWGHGIDILNSSNIHVINPIIKNTWGDGIYIGHNFWGSSTKITKRILIDGADIDGSRRNGISVCSGLDIVINNPVIKNINGTNPKAGIDIEPEGKGGALPILDNVTINNPIISNSDYGVIFLFEELKDRGLKTNIHLNNPKIISCGSPLAFAKLSGSLNGAVNCSNVQILNCRLSAILVEGYNAVNTPHIQINGIIVDGFNVSNSDNTWYNHFLTIISYEESPATTDIGNISIINPVIKDNVNTLFRFICCVLNGSTKKIKHVTIINPKIITSKEITNFVRSNHDIRIIDELKSLNVNDGYYKHYVDGSLTSEISNEQATEDITYYSTDANIPIGHKLKLRMVKNHRMNFNPTSYVLGQTAVGRGMYSEINGSVLELTFDGSKWLVDTNIGWFPQT